MSTLSSVAATVLVCMFSAGGIYAVDPPGLMSFSTLASSSSTRTRRRQPSPRPRLRRPDAVFGVHEQSPTTTPTRSASRALAPGTADLPSDVLDLRNWYLTLPTGTAGAPDTVNQPKLDTYTGTAFGLNDAKNGVVFTTTAGGVTTSGSTYPRSELREMAGTRKASWSNKSGTHTLVARQAITELPAVKPEVVTAQIHNTSDDVMEVRLEGNRLLAQYNNGQRDITIDPAYVLGTVFDLRIVASSGKVRVYYNDVLKATISKSGSGWYFKSGSYLQTNTSKGDKPTAAGVVVTYALQVTHS